MSLDIRPAHFGRAVAIAAALTAASLPAFAKEQSRGGTKLECAYTTMFAPDANHNLEAFGVRSYLGNVVYHPIGTPIKINPDGIKTEGNVIGFLLSRSAGRVESSEFVPVPKNPSGETTITVKADAGEDIQPMDNSEPVEFPGGYDVSQYTLLRYEKDQPYSIRDGLGDVVYRGKGPFRVALTDALHFNDGQSEVEAFAKRAQMTNQQGCPSEPIEVYNGSLLPDNVSVKGNRYLQTYTDSDGLTWVNAKPAPR